MPRSAFALVLATGFSIGVTSAAVLSAWGPADRNARSGPAPAAVPSAASRQDVGAIDPDDPESLDRLLAQLTTKRVVFVGETHDRYDHHLNQLAIIRGLRERGVDLAVGMESFQEPFQQALNQYIAGEIPEKALLKRTAYYERWRFDYRLYRDILEYARSRSIPLIALNAPSEMVAKVSRGGFEGLTAEERARLPADLSSAGKGYQARLRPIFEAHGKTSGEHFRRFVQVQMLWDEHMARVARDYLADHPEKTLVVLAGSGHIAYPDAIPDRLERMLPSDQAVVVIGAAEGFSGGRYDFRLAERDIDLPAPGRLGVVLASDDSAVRLQQVKPDSPAAASGLRAGDRVLSIAGEPIRQIEDVSLALLDRAPGEEVWIEIERLSGARGQEARLGGAVMLF